MPELGRKLRRSLDERISVVYCTAAKRCIINRQSFGLSRNKVRQAAMGWMLLRNVTPNPNSAPAWREAWHPAPVQVWDRLAENAEDCEAIHWLHAPYWKAMPKAKISEGSIYRSSMTGQIGQIGGLWHRMYSVVRLVKNPEDLEGKPIPKITRQYLELLTIFPDDSPECDDFLTFLETHPKKLVEKFWST